MFTYCLDPVFPFIHRSFGMYKKNGCFVLMHVHIFIKLYIYIQENHQATVRIVRQ